MINEDKQCNSMSSTLHNYRRKNNLCCIYQQLQLFLYEVPVRFPWVCLVRQVPGTSEQR